MHIINFTEEHYSQVADIYLQGIATGNATFQTTAPSWDNWHISHFQHSRIAGLSNNQIIGWAALTPVSSRRVYAGVAEVSIYIATQFQGQGIGYKLLNQLIVSSEQNGIWTLQSGIFPENVGSIKLHQKCGFRIIGHREKIGNMNGIWRDNIIMERRSTTVGI